ncbi:SUKH-3 domain-containing protein [Polyangium sp. y55x31]|uniref:SUKH-3 domain-containing protein n=1 Tax=Polyangium sp. y55x31 TaxID=3042688 RepID=UPI002482681D|nr:SUKH-3 domain-containing protein [Polyangium sp. y55x31]MDI1477374.1 SUKH-3 domain-containing protein [Polyangium sp. y55x31]
MFRSPGWSAETEARLMAAGWHKDRRDTQRVAQWRRKLENPNGFRMSIAAERALEEFGGIRVDCEGPGLECARGGFDLDPGLASGEEDRFDAFRDQVGSDLFPLGEAYNGQAFLAIDGMGRVYLLGDRIQLLGANIHSALDSILVGRLPRG